MNFNALIAVLVLKSILTEDEAERLVEHLNDKPQSTVLKDAIAAVAEVIGKPQPSIMHNIAPVGPAQQAEEQAARAAAIPTAPPVVEPELAANEPMLDEDQANEILDEGKADAEVAKNKPSDTASEDKPASDEPAKTTSVDKSTEEPKKK